MFKKVFLFVAITIHCYAMELEKQKHCNEINRIQPNSSISEFKEGQEFYSSDYGLIESKEGYYKNRQNRVFNDINKTISNNVRLIESKIQEVEKLIFVYINIIDSNNEKSGSITLKLPKESYDSDYDGKMDYR